MLSIMLFVAVYLNQYQNYDHPIVKLYTKIILRLQLMSMCV